MAERETLRETVEAQARALVEGDLAAFASYAAPQALPSMYRAPRAVAHGFDIVDVDVASDYGRSEVRFRGTSSYVMRGSWQLTTAGWKAIALEIPRASVRSAWWRRILRRTGNLDAVPEREDLS